MAFNEKKIRKGMFICHSCDNRKCVNPDHLFLGSLRDNHNDMMSKNRQAKGSRMGCAKLNEQKAVEIRKLYSEGFHTQNQLAKIYGVRQTKISDLVNRKTWKHI